MVLFSLRYVQEHLNPEDFEGAEHFIGEDYGPMDDEEISDLCMQLNCDDGIPEGMEDLFSTIKQYRQWVRDNTNVEGDLTDDVRTAEARADWDRSITEAVEDWVSGQPAKEKKAPFNADECPNCTSEEIKAGEFDLEGEFRENECTDCGAKWKVIYHAMDAYEVQVPDGKT
jgi:hypothetical protein